MHCTIAVADQDGVVECPENFGCKTSKKKYASPDSHHKTTGLKRVATDDSSYPAMTRASNDSADGDAGVLNDARATTTATAEAPNKTDEEARVVTSESSPETPINVGTSSAETAPCKRIIPAPKEQATDKNPSETIPNPFCLRHETGFYHLLSEISKKDVKHYSQNGRYLNLAKC
jgi:hypothetical protein